MMDKSVYEGDSDAREDDGEDDGDGNGWCGFGCNLPRCRRRRRGLVWQRRISAAMAMKAAAMVMAITMASENLAKKIFSSGVFLARWHLDPQWHYGPH